MKQLPLLAAAVLLSLATGCGPTLGIVRTRPAPVNLSPATDVSVEVKAREMGMREALATALGGGGLTAATRALELSLREELTRPRSKFRVLPPESAQCRLGVTVMDWNHEVREEQPQASSSSKANAAPPAPKRTIHGRMEAVLAATCAHRGQQVLTRSFTVQRTAELAPRAYEMGVHEQLLREEARVMADELAAVITPHEYADYVRIDDSEKPLAPAVKLMKDGQLPAARSALESHLASNPSSAAAAYNLGVLDEADGNLDAARAHYAQAQGIAPDPLYAAGLERVARVEGERAALAGQQP